MRARVLARRGRYDRRAFDDALACLDEARQLAGSVEYVGTGYHVTLERAELLLAMGKAADAKEAALTLFHAPEAESELDRLRALVIATEAMFVLGKLSLARTMARATVERGEAIGAPELKYRGHRVLARAAYREGALAEALAHYDAAGVALRSTVDELVHDQRADFLQDKDVIYSEACLAALEARAPLRALTYLEQARVQAIWRTHLGGDSLGGDPSRRERQRMTSRAPDDPDELGPLLRRHRALSVSLRTTFANDPARAEIERELAHLSHQILERLAAQAERERKGEVFDGDALMARVPQQTTALAYALIDDTLVTFVIAEQRVVAVQRCAGGAQRVRRLERELRLRIADLTQQGLSDAQAITIEMLARWTTAWQGTMQELWALLIAPVERFLPPEGETLTLIPHHMLHTLPLSALYDGAHYLVERWLVRCVPSVQTFSATPPAQTAPRGRQPVLALGYSDGGTLPQAAEQADAVVHIFGGISLTEAEATGARLREECGGRTYLHLSAHGEWRIDVPYASFIQLADGPLHPTDVVLLDLRGCHLVTLSACQTGKGQTSGGDAFIGLAQAFHEAGAEAVLATLWRVEARATQAFMQRFYERLAIGATPALALRGAQLACLREPGERLLSSPFGWAGFQLTEYVLRPDSPTVTTTEVAASSDSDV
jgi:CHAT domain-containing protein